MKVEGHSVFNIYFSLYEKWYLIGSFLGILVLVLFGLIRFGNKYTIQGFCVVTIAEYLMFLIAQQIVSFLLVFIIDSIPIVSSEKGKDNLQALFTFSYFIKIVAVILVIPRITNFIPDLKQYVLMASRYSSASNILENYYYFGTEKASSYFADIGTDQYYKVYETFKEHGLIRFSEDYLYEDVSDMIPCYVVKEEYLIKEGLYDPYIDYENTIVFYLKEGVEYDTEKMERYVKKKLFRNTDITYRYITESPHTYSPYELLFSDTINDDPIVYLPDDYGYEGQIEGSIFYFNGTLEEAQSYADNVFHEYGYESALRIGPASTNYKQYYAYYQNIYIRNFIKCFLLILSYFLAHRLLINTDIECNKDRYYIAMTEGVDPNKLWMYIYKIISPVLLGIIVVFIQNHNAINENDFLTLMIGLIVLEVISFIWYQQKIRNIQR